MTMSEEQWRQIREFSNYQISNLGRIYNDRRGTIMSTTLTLQGHVKISIINDHGRRRTMSVAQLVAEAFVEPPNGLADRVVVLDGNFEHVAAENLAWRSRSFAWSYAHQLNTRQPVYFRNLPVVNLSSNRQYESIIEAGMKEGLLFVDIWRSTHRRESIYPYGAVFQVVDPYR